MPPHCGICTLNNGTFCYAVEGKEHELEDVEDYADIGERPKWCPLVEIPKHGRLIDADKLHERINETVNEGLIFSGMTIAEFIELLIDDAPTIIEGDTE